MVAQSDEAVGALNEYFFRVSEMFTKTKIDYSERQIFDTI